MNHYAKHLVATLAFAVGLLGAGCGGDHNRGPASEGGQAAPPNANTASNPSTASNSNTPSKTTSESKTSAVTSTSKKSTVKKSKKGQTLTPEERKAREGHKAESGQLSAPPSGIDQNRGLSSMDQASPEVTTQNEKLGLSKSQEKMVCDPSDKKHGHAQFLRPDLAYSVTGLDCFGDRPFNQVTGEPIHDMTRLPASQACPHDPHGHAPFLREDIAYGVLGVDCWGSDQSSQNQYNNEPAE